MTSGCVWKFTTLFHFQQLRGHHINMIIEFTGKFDKVTSVVRADIL